MSTPNAPQPPKVSGQQKNSNQHIAVVMQEAAIKLTRKLTDDESTVAWKFAVAADHEVTAAEVLAAINEPVPPKKPGNGRTKRSKKIEITSVLLNRAVEEALGRELTPAEQGTIQGAINDLRGDTLITEESYSVAVKDYAAEFKAEAEEAAEEARIAAEQANPPLEKWTTQATDLGTTLKAKIGTFAAMKPAVEQVRESFGSLKDAIDAGRLPKTALIMPTYQWKKTTRDGKHTTDQNGFLDFKDYCSVILKRGKSAVYQMLKDANMPKEKKDPDNSLVALVSRGAKSFINLHKKLSDKDKQETSFDSFTEKIVLGARALMAAELATKRSEANQPAATPASPKAPTIAHEEHHPLPPSQGQAG